MHSALRADVDPGRSGAVRGQRRKLSGSGGGFILLPQLTPPARDVLGVRSIEQLMHSCGAEARGSSDLANRQALLRRRDDRPNALELGISEPDGGRLQPVQDWPALVNLLA